MHLAYCYYDDCMTAIHSPKYDITTRKKGQNRAIKESIVALLTSTKAMCRDFTTAT